MDLRDKYDTSNPMIAKIIAAKEERLKLLKELRKDFEEDFVKVAPLESERSSPKKVIRRSKPTRDTPPPQPTRRSLRISNGGNVSYKDLDGEEEVYEEDEYGIKIKKKHYTRIHSSNMAVRIKRPRPPNSYGHIPGVDVGTHWDTRLECSDDAVHRPTVAGIHAGEEGAYSIALSGGYPEDVDEGENFKYTGAGGRDLKGTKATPKNLRTAPQTKDQELTGVNYSLVKNIETGRPIRVIRGYKSPSVYAPEFGYRYDGLYKVVRYWEDIGKTGYRVYRFEMVRLEDQPPPPWAPDFVQPKKRDRTIEDLDNAEAYGDSEDEQEGDDDDDVNNGDENKENIEETSEMLSEKLTLLESEESKVDTEINIYKERLCKNSIFLSDFKDNSGEESSFCGFD